MNSIFSFLISSFVSVHSAAFIWIVAFFGFSQTFGQATMWGLLAAGTTFFALQVNRKHKWLKKNEITKKEYKYIKDNLKEANTKVKRLNKTLFQIRSIREARQIGKLQRLTSRIYHIVKKEPKRFYRAERFFFYHLDSTVELTEKYIFLTRQQLKKRQLRQSLLETEETLEKLIESIEEDLMNVLSNDIDELEFELKVAKHSMKQDEKLI